MKPLLILILSFLITLNAIGQQNQAVDLGIYERPFQNDLPDSGFTNKADAKNLMANGKKEGKWVEYGFKLNGVTHKLDTVDYTLVVYKRDTVQGISREYNYFDNKKLIENVYHNGEMFLERMFDGRGEMEAETLYKKGELMQENKYYPRGILKTITFYSNDKPPITKNYDENGNEIKQ